MKKTSVTAYLDLLDENKIRGMQLQVLRTLARLGPLTGRELNEALKSVSAHKRLSELEARGAVEVAGERRCTESGKMVEFWQLTGRVPSAAPIKAKRLQAKLPLPVDKLRSCLPLLRRTYIQARTEMHPSVNDVRDLLNWMQQATAWSPPATAAPKMPPPRVRSVADQRKDLFPDPNPTAPAR